MTKVLKRLFALVMVITIFSAIPMTSMAATTTTEKIQVISATNSINPDTGENVVTVEARINMTNIYQVVVVNSNNARVSTMTKTSNGTYVGEFRDTPTKDVEKTYYVKAVTTSVGGWETAQFSVQLYSYNETVRLIKTIASTAYYTYTSNDAMKGNYFRMLLMRNRIEYSATLCSGNKFGVLVNNAIIIINVK